MSDFISAFPSAWVARYANIPKFPARSILPEHDGDMAYLRDTAAAILEAVGGIFTDRPRRVMMPPSGEFIYRQTIHCEQINPHQILRYWPADVAGELLRQWKAAGR